MKTRRIGIVLSVCVLLLLVTCKTTPQYSDLAEELASTKYGYFTLREHNEKGEYGPVFIFTEQHNSRLIQAEIAWGLDVLREKRGINSVALEGMFIGEVMDAEKVEYNSETEKYIVTLALLEHGEIKAPELLYLAMDSFVFGTEIEDQYNVRQPNGNAAYSAIINYLILSIGVDYGMDTLDAVRGKFSVGIDAAGREWLFSQYPWTRETFEIVYVNGVRSTVKISNRLAELDEKVGQLASSLPPSMRADFRQLKEYYETANQRSLTMAGHVLDTLRVKNEPLSMIIGAGHTLEVVEFFEKNNVSYYVLEPDGLYDTSIYSDLTSAEYGRRVAGKPLFANRQIERFFTNGHNPRPVVGKDWFDKENNFVLLVKRMIDLESEPQDQSVFFNNGLWVSRDSLDISNRGDIKFYVENEKGERIFVRAVLNSQGNRFESFRKALEEIRDRLYKIDVQNPPFTERIKAYKGLIEVFSVSEYSVFISPSDEVWNLNIAAL